VQHGINCHKEESQISEPGDTTIREKANALTSECKCEDNNKQNASRQHQNLGGVEDFNGAWAHLQCPDIPYW
jgi:hypothetical protein